LTILLIRRQEAYRCDRQFESQHQQGNTMALKLPESVKQLLTDKAYGHVVTINPDGSPQCTMVWMDVDGDFATYNTAEGRLKVRNLRLNPNIMVSVQSKVDPQAYVTLKGKATLTEEGADAHIDKLAKRFMGVDKIGGFAPGMKPWA